MGSFSSHSFLPGWNNPMTVEVQMAKRLSFAFSDCCRRMDTWCMPSSPYATLSKSSVWLEAHSHFCLPGIALYLFLPLLFYGTKVARTVCIEFCLGKNYLPVMYGGGCLLDWRAKGKFSVGIQAWPGNENSSRALFWVLLGDNDMSTASRGQRLLQTDIPNFPK